MPPDLGFTAITLPATTELSAMLYGTRWTATTLSFSFITDRALYVDDPLLTATDTFTPATLTQQREIETALTGTSALPGGPLMTLTPISGFTNLSFVNANGADATLRFGSSNSPGLPSAQGSFPGYIADFPGESRDGTIWFGTTGNDYSQPQIGDFSFRGILHEIGHTLGLKHPFQDVLHNGTIMPLATDSLEYSVMSYSSVANRAGQGYFDEPFGYPMTYSMYDIAGLQELYGANYNFRAGNTTYRFDPTTGETFVDGVSQGVPGADRIFETIWDGGGTDTYDFSLYAGGVSVDLSPGRWSVAAADQLAVLDVDAGIKAQGNVYNALEYQGSAASLVENAIGGAGSDTLLGNAAANLLDGGGGNDSLAGGLGDDTLLGGDGDDALAASAGQDSLDGGAGLDTALLDPADATGLAWSTNTLAGTITVSDSHGTVTLRGVEALQLGGLVIDLTVQASGHALAGGAGDDSLSARSLQHVLDGAGGNDSLRGLGGSDVLLGGSGDDTLSGGNGTDALFGGEGQDELAGGFGADDLRGQDGDDQLHGDAGDDLLAGGSGNDWLYGDAGADKLLGGEGDDVLSGGAGADTVTDQAGDNFLYGDGGNDLLVAEGVGHNELSGDAGNDSLTASEGEDTLFGGSGDDLLVLRGSYAEAQGGAGDDSIDGAAVGFGQAVIFGGGGDDTVVGTSGDDYVSGDAGDDLVDARFGNDTVLGGNGNDTVTGLIGRMAAFGGGGEDSLHGGIFGDLLRGGSGDDTLDGGHGADVLTGGEGADRFIFAAGDGTDRVTDFTVGTDLIELQGFGLDDVAAVLAHLHVRGGSTLLANEEGDEILLVGVAAASLGAGDFVFTPAEILIG